MRLLKSFVKLSGIECDGFGGLPGAAAPGAKCKGLLVVHGGFYTGSVVRVGAGELCQHTFLHGVFCLY